MKLGELLMREGLLTVAQLETALMHQRQLGVRLGTSLVELRFVDVDVIARALSAQHRVPAVLSKHVVAIDPKVIAKIPAKVALAHRAVPLGFTQTTPPRLVVALRDPHATPVEEIAFVAGMRVDAAVAPELIIKQCLTKYYEGGAIDMGSMGGVRTLETPPDSIVPMPSSSRQPAAATPKTLSAPPAPISAPKITADVDETIAKLGEATSSDAIGDLLVEYMRYRYACGLVLIVKDGSALGWKGFATHADQDAVESIAMPLASPSFLKDAHDTHTIFAGVPPAEGNALQTRLWKLLREKPPEAVVVAPIVLGKRVINLIYAHPDEGIALPENAAADFGRLATAAATDYTRVIKTRK